MEEEKKKEEVKTNEIYEIQKKNGNKIIIIILCVGLFLIGFGVGFLITNTLLGGNKENKEKSNENQELIDNKNDVIDDNNDENTNTIIDDTKNDKNDNITGEKEINSSSLINLLNTKFNILFGDFTSVLGENDNKSLFGRALENEEFVELKEEENKEGDYAYFVGTLSQDVIEKKYFDLFGEQLNKNDEYVGICSNVNYNSNKGAFVQKKYGCDAGWGWFVRDYIYKYTEDENNAYIYVATAVFDGIEEIVVLSDSELKYEYTTIENTNDFNINETNYKDFAKYKVTFRKDGNNYYYKGVTKVENGVKK